MAFKQFSITQAIKAALPLYFRNAGLLLSVALVMIGVTYAPNYFSQFFITENNLPAKILLAALTGALGVFAGLGVSRVSLHLVDGKEAGWTDMLSGGRLYLNALLASFIVWLLTGLPGIFFGFLAKNAAAPHETVYRVCGLAAGLVAIYFGGRYLFLQLYMVEKERGSFASLYGSARITAGAMLQLIVIFLAASLSLMGAGFILAMAIRPETGDEWKVGAALVPIIIVALPLIMLSLAQIYRTLSAQTTDEFAGTTSAG